MTKKYLIIVSFILLASNLNISNLWTMREAQYQNWSNSESVQITNTENQIQLRKVWTTVAVQTQPDYKPDNYIEHVTSQKSKNTSFNLNIPRSLSFIAVVLLGVGSYSLYKFINPKNQVLRHRLEKNKFENDEARQ